MVDDEYLQRLEKDCDWLIEEPDSRRGRTARTELKRLLYNAHDMQAIIALARTGFNVGKIENKTEVGISVLCNRDYEPSIITSLKAVFWRMINSLFPPDEDDEDRLEGWSDMAKSCETMEYAGRRIRRRPRVLDPEVKEDIFEAIRPDIVSLFRLDKDNEWDAERLAALKRSFLRHYNLDGCATASAMEWDGVFVSTWGFAEIIENAPYEMILRRHVRRWINEENVFPQYRKGQLVTWSRGEGVIDQVRYKYSPGCYSIRRTDIPIQDRSRREIVPWEECRLVGEP